MFVLDTNAVSALLAGDKALGALLEHDDRHALPVIVIGEYRFGLVRSKHRRSLEPLLDQLIEQSLVLAIDDATTHAYASVRESLRRKGTPLPENDVWIAALAEQHQLAIVTRDEHFEDVEGIVRHSW